MTQVFEVESYLEDEACTLCSRPPEHTTPSTTTILLRLSDTEHQVPVCRKCEATRRPTVSPPKLRSIEASASELADAAGVAGVEHYEVTVEWGEATCSAPVDSYKILVAAAADMAAPDGDAAALEQRQKHNASGGGAWQPAWPAWHVVLPTALSSDSSSDLTDNAALFSRKTEQESLPQTAAPFSKYVSKYVATADTGVSSSSVTLEQSLENRGLGPRESVSISLPAYTYPVLYRHTVMHPSQHTFRLPAGHYYFKLQARR